MEKEALVLDASVIVKWFCEEEYTDIALGLRQRFITADKVFSEKVDTEEVLFIGDLE